MADEKEDKPPVKPGKNQNFRVPERKDRQTESDGRAMGQRQDRRDQPPPDKGGSKGRKL